MAGLVNYNVFATLSCDGTYDHFEESYTCSISGELHLIGNVIDNLQYYNKILICFTYFVIENGNVSCQHCSSCCHCNVKWSCIIPSLNGKTIA